MRWQQPSMAPSGEAVERRAIEAVNWGMPAVNFDQMYQAMVRDAKGGKNQIVYWSRLFDWKNQTLTPNPDVIYVMPFFDTKEAGPMVLELPPASAAGSITGTIMDCWQAPLEDVGRAGLDKGRGGKYLILPPGYTKPLPKGYLPLRSANYQGYALLRSILAGGSEADQAKAVDYAKRIRLYPLSQASAPPPTRFVDAIDVVFDAKIPYDLRFFQSLDRIVQYEPWLPRDKVMIDMLRTIGIEKGKPFAPDAATQESLNRAAATARQWLDARYASSFPRFYEQSRWTPPFVPEIKDTVATMYETADAYSVDARGLADTYAFSTIKHLGAGQFYLITVQDKDGKPLDGATTYRLTIPLTRPCGNTGRSCSTIASSTRSFATLPGRADPRSHPGYRKTVTAALTCISGRGHRRARNRTGYRPIRHASSKPCSARMRRKSAFFEKTWTLPDIVAEKY